MSTSLAHEQSLLLSALAGYPSDFAARLHPRGLEVYLANRAVLAERTLASTYPVITQLIGVESFEPLARYFWKMYPPERGDMGQWGAQLADFLSTAPQLADEPFLGDVARLEWALHCAASAADAVLDAASFALLAKLAGADDAPPVTLVLSPGTVLFTSAYPVVSIFHAHLTGQGTLEKSAEMLARGIGEFALVWRQGYQPKVRTVSVGEHQLVRALNKGQALDTALLAATQMDPLFDFSTWLAAAVQSGLVVAAVPVKT